MNHYVGKFEIMSSENYDEFLKAFGIGMIQRNLEVKLKPIIDISVSGEDFLMKTTTQFTTTQLTFRLGIDADYDIWGKVVKTVTTKEGDKFVQEMSYDSLQCTRIMDFYSSEMKEIWNAKGIMSVRIYKRV